MDPIVAVATEAPGAEVGRFQRGELGQLGLLVEFAALEAPYLGAGRVSRDRSDRLH